MWEKAMPIPGMDPAKFRKDAYGNTLSYDQYGMNCDMGWDIDHIEPASRGGSDDIQNLQALKTSVNRQKGDRLVRKMPWDV